MRYEIKSEIYGCCIKLLTGQAAIRDRWEENFYFASQNIRSHGRLYVLQDESEGPNRIYYDPLSKTCFLFNVDYYGWIKSLALSVAGDILEDNHGIYSVHGACLDAHGMGLCILGGSGAGKTTHTYGLLRSPRTRVVSDDWFFARVYGEDILAYGSEKNFYIRADLAEIWKEFSGLMDKAAFDEKGRAVVDLRWVIGKGRILPLTTLGDHDHPEAGQRRQGDCPGAGRRSGFSPAGGERLLQSPPAGQERVQAPASKRIFPGPAGPGQGL